MAEESSARRPFVFGVGFILDEPNLESLLHQQFKSDNELKNHLSSQGFEVVFSRPRVTIDNSTGVVVEAVQVNKGGGVGSLELIDQKDVPKLQNLITEAADVQRRRKLGDKTVMGLFG